MFSVETKNPFLVLSGGEPVSAPAPVEQDSKSSAAPAEKKRNNSSSNNSSNSNAPATRGRGGYRGRGGDRNRGDRVDRAERGDRPPRRGGDRGGKRGGGARGGKRQFDRKSGTGRPKNESKKGDYGKGNWGKPGDSQLEASLDNEAGVERELTAEELERKAEQEADEKMITLAEYEKKKSEQAASLPQLPEARKPNDGNTKTWDGFKKLEKSSTVDESDALAKKEKKTKKQFVPLDEVFNPAAFTESSRSGRDTKKKKFGQTHKKGGKFSIDDEKSFPALGAK